MPEPSRRHTIVYIAGPYREKCIYDTVQNIRKAEMYACEYWRKGYTVICPHKNTALLDGWEPDEVWLEGAKELLRRSDIIVMIPGWQSSKGSVAEYELALELGKEIITP